MSIFLFVADILSIYRNICRPESRTYLSISEGAEFQVFQEYSRFREPKAEEDIRKMKIDDFGTEEKISLLQKRKNPTEPFFETTEKYHIFRRPENSSTPRLWSDKIFSFLCIFQNKRKYFIEQKRIRFQNLFHDSRIIFQWFSGFVREIFPIHNRRICKQFTK